MPRRLTTALVLAAVLCLALPVGTAQAQSGDRIRFFFPEARKLTTVRRWVKYDGQWYSVASYDSNLVAVTVGGEGLPGEAVLTRVIVAHFYALKVSGVHGALSSRFLPATEDISEQAELIRQAATALVAQLSDPPRGPVVNAQLHQEIGLYLDDLERAITPIAAAAERLQTLHGPMRDAARGLAAAAAALQAQAPDDVVVQDLRESFRFIEENLAAYVKACEDTYDAIKVHGVILRKLQAVTRALPEASAPAGVLIVAGPKLTQVPTGTGMWVASTATALNNAEADAASAISAGLGFLLGNVERILTPGDTALSALRAFAAKLAEVAPTEDVSAILAALNEADLRRAAVTAAAAVDWVQSARLAEAAAKADVELARACSASFLPVVEALNTRYPSPQGTEALGAAAKRISGDRPAEAMTQLTLAVAAAGAAASRRRLHIAILVVASLLALTVAGYLFVRRRTPPKPQQQPAMFPSTPARGTQVSAILELQRPGGLTEQYLLGTLPVSIGRIIGNEIVLAGDDVERLHCRVLFERGESVLYDTSGRSATLVNGERVSRRILKDGDIISVGSHAFAFRRVGQGPHA